MIMAHCGLGRASQISCMTSASTLSPEAIGKEVVVVAVILFALTGHQCLCHWCQCHQCLKISFVPGSFSSLVLRLLNLRKSHNPVSLTAHPLLNPQCLHRASEILFPVIALAHLPLFTVQLTFLIVIPRTVLRVHILQVMCSRLLYRLYHPGTLLLAILIFLNGPLGHPLLHNVRIYRVKDDPVVVRVAVRLLSHWLGLAVAKIVRWVDQCAHHRCQMIHPCTQLLAILICLNHCRAPDH